MGVLVPKECSRTRSSPFSRSTRFAVSWSAGSPREVNARFCQRGRRARWATCSVNWARVERRTSSLMNTAGRVARSETRVIVIPSGRVFFTWKPGAHRPLTGHHTSTRSPGRSPRSVPRGAGREEPGPMTSHSRSFPLCVGFDVGSAVQVGLSRSSGARVGPLSRPSKLRLFRGDGARLGRGSVARGGGGGIHRPGDSQHRHTVPIAPVAPQVWVKPRPKGRLGRTCPGRRCRSEQRNSDWIARGSPVRHGEVTMLRSETRRTIVRDRTIEAGEVCGPSTFAHRA